MNIILWILAGGCVGWAALAILRWNESRGAVATAVIGAVGGLVGGKILAPILTSPAALPGDFSFSALLIAVLSATACLAAGNMIQNRFGV
jgi:uncharacterized membrane protein YeaQ/YmgE (transglycosylase-associated protein family)